VIRDSSFRRKSAYFHYLGLFPYGLMIATYNSTGLFFCCTIFCLLFRSETSSGFMMSDTPVPFVCPWTCLVSPSPKPSVVAPMVSNRSFAQALVNKVDVSLSDLPKPCLKGDSFSIKISEHVYQAGLSNCNNYIHERLVLARGDKTFSSKDLRECKTRNLTTTKSRACILF
jgi:hypothetical protein